MLCCPFPHVVPKVAVTVVWAGLHVQDNIVCCCELTQVSCQENIPAFAQLPLEDLQNQGCGNATQCSVWGVQILSYLPPSNMM